MKRYYDVDAERIWTEDEIRHDWVTLKAVGEIDPEMTFEHYLESCLLDNNGSLEPIAPDWEIRQLRRYVASDLACDEMPYGKVLEVLERLDIFGNWSEWEIAHRPVDLDEVREIVEEELGLL